MQRHWDLVVFIKNRLKRLLLLFIFVFLLSSCEEEIDLDLPSGEKKIVVEGYIEQNMPPFVVLTSTLPYFSGKNIQEIQQSFVHKAIITVSNGNKTASLREFSSDSLPLYLKPFLKQVFSINSNVGDSSNQFHFNYYFYTNDTLLNMLGEKGKGYKISINVGENKLSAETRINPAVPLDSIWSKPHEDPKKDSLLRLWAQYSDPDSFGNYVRYFTKRNKEIFYPGYFGSVFDDKFINGQKFRFSLEPGRDRNATIERENLRYFKRGDTVIVKWSTIDKAQFEFWRTMEQDRNTNGNPFGSPTVIKSNITGGLGIWGGMSSVYDTLVMK